MERLRHLNGLTPDEARKEFVRCCGSRRWVEAMAAARPFRGVEQLFEMAQSVWRSLSPEDWLEAFRSHPQIGGRGQGWSAQEQSGVSGASEDVLGALARGNSEYEAKFGYIFIVCATGKTASELLAALKTRLKNSPEAELRIAAEEQNKIARIRLEKLLDS